MNSDYALLETKIEYVFKDKDLLLNALTHTSFANEHRSKGIKDNERLEFLGDAVLELVSSEFLFKTMPDMPEGNMTKLRASLVCEPTLANDAREIGLEEFIYLGKGEEETGGRKRNSIVSDAFEALIGSIFLDGGIDNARDFIIKFALNDIENKRLFYDSKTILQERINIAKVGKVSYEITGETGPDHNKTYEVAAMLDDKVIGSGMGHTKKGG
ncbi:MAG: ribonuclease III [Eubacterium sp.]